MSGLFDFLEAVDRAILVGNLYETVNNGAIKYFLRPTVLIPLVILIGAYIWADKRLEDSVRPRKRERYKRSGVLHGVFGGLGEVYPEGRVFWFIRLAICLAAIGVMALNAVRPPDRDERRPVRPYYSPSPLVAT